LAMCSAFSMNSYREFEYVVTRVFERVVGGAFFVAFEREKPSLSAFSPPLYG
jgi:hypothetical protein